MEGCIGHCHRSLTPAGTAATPGSWAWSPPRRARSQVPPDTAIAVAITARAREAGPKRRRVAACSGTGSPRLRDEDDAGDHVHAAGVLELARLLRRDLDRDGLPERQL